ncbi:MAG: TAXI family TRAP transporter solute-binding subunit [Deltaproteobacteria bacterium]|nr:TAXI family TRAP transporter solute-binding subunit [Deltaproteobacteria bacterium]MBW2046921.1 TAXI family TRAP transporter solute-binding subunit [Deltaproteobacteria bacterium]MBW2110966.1 TAXI family TRAP transporter solute-binding subunit [Deltaproteobacteria bacterium]MBW2351724.1 TAXI family TRAP transporter solute-binding subunit [Deltaproteobacteria bacterium]HDZ90124.1 TAXI family TRAP transporter solute-binding subunit [Deltaproteobacteria bacterium]
MKRRTAVVTVFCICATLLLAGAFSTDSLGGDKRLLSIATASTGGSWYPAGGAISSLINKYIPDTEASAHPSAASRENVRLLEEKKTDLAMVMPSVAYFAQSGTGIYKGKPPAKIKGLFSFWGIDLLIIARADTDIYKIEDLRGKKVGFGPPGSGSANMSKKILEEYGLSYKDMKPQFISATEQSQALKDGTLDAAMYTIGTPASTFVDLCTLTKCRILPIENGMMKKILKKYPYYAASVIPANAYPQIDKATPALKWVGIVITYDDLDPDLAYKIVKTVCKDHLDEFKQCHAKAKELTTMGMSKGMSIPWHPGAARFWKEIGAIN